MRLLLAAIATAGLCTSVLAAVLAASDLLAEDARDRLERWRADGRAAVGDAWASVDERLRAARDLAPRDAGLRAARAEVYTWWLVASAGPPARRAQVLAAARDEQLAAVARRPTWPMAWARLAEIDYLAGRGVEAIWPSVREASRLGPWEPGVHLVTVRVGLGLWAELDAAQRAQVERAAVRSLEAGENWTAFAMLAVHHRRVGWLAALSEDEGYRRRLAGYLSDASR